MQFILQRKRYLTLFFKSIVSLRGLKKSKLPHCIMVNRSYSYKTLFQLESNYSRFFFAVAIYEMT